MADAAAMGKAKNLARVVSAVRHKAGAETMTVQQYATRIRASTEVLNARLRRRKAARKVARKPKVVVPTPTVSGNAVARSAQAANLKARTQAEKINNSQQTGTDKLRLLLPKASNNVNSNRVSNNHANNNRAAVDVRETADVNRRRRRNAHLADPFSNAV